MKKTALLLMTFVWLLQGCVPVLVGGAAVGGATIYDRRSSGTVIDDNTLELNLASKIANIKRLADNSHVNVTVYNGLVLLTGEAVNQEIKNEIGELVINNEINGVKRLANYLIIGPRSSFMNRAFDSKQTSKVKTALFDVNVAGFDPSRVKVITEHGVVFLMGILTTQEAQATENVVRRVSEVKQVVTLFEIDDQLYQKSEAATIPANTPTYNQEYRSDN